jgi:4,5-DOPA dioxygenase extradiol
MTTTLPTLFLSHGSPMIALEPGEAGHFMQRLGPVIDATFGRPKAVLVMSPHTATRTATVLGAAQHGTIHDFGGFPAPLYDVRYDAPGEPEVSRHVDELIETARLPGQWTPQGGLDHGIWTTLMHMYPKADVPVVPLSMVPMWSPQQAMEMGQALRSLRDEGVLVIGSGSITHNLRRFFTQPTPVDAPETADCAAFRAWVLDRSAERDWAALQAWETLAPHAKVMHPTDDHWLPFYFAAGAGMGDGDDGDVGPQAVRVHGSVTYGHLAMDAYAFGPGAEVLQAALG